MHAPIEHPREALAAVGLDAGALSALEGLAIVEIAGRDSIAAAVTAVRARGFSRLLPTSVATATEYGDPGAPSAAATHLAGLVAGEAEVLPHVRIGSPALWAALNARFASVLAERFGIHSPCLSCHLYMHLARVPLSWALGHVPVIAGERDTHGGRIKLSQTPLGIDASIRVLASGGVELLEPVRSVRDASVIADLVGPGWHSSSRELRCVHSGNYLGLDGRVTYDEAAYGRYMRDFFEPAGMAIVDAWRLSADPDYDAVIRDVLRLPA